MVTLKIRGAERNCRARTKGPKKAANLIIRPSSIGFVRPRFEPRIFFHQTDPDPKHFKSDRLRWCSVCERHGTGDSDFRPKKKTNTVLCIYHIFLFSLSPTDNKMQKLAIFRARRWLCRSFSGISSNPLRVCVVGSGPAGFYTAEKVKP